MKSRVHKRIRVFSLVLLTAFILSVHTQAAQPTGSITISVRADAAAASMDVTLWRVADFDQNQYALVPSFAGSDVALNALSTVEQQLAAARTLAIFSVQHQLCAAQRVTVSAGKALFPSLDRGLYLLRITGGGAELAEPFLVSIPLQNAADGGWSYHVTAAPKIAPGGTLPQTGQNYLGVLLCACAGIALLCAGGAELRRSKKASREKP
ncbi:MAG: hypothetical protein RR194_03040 [Ruthenibacterium sp.]